jgi:putative FmdB family regulatory protein
MPIYEYQCSACGHQLEMMQKIADDPLTICPVCQQTTLNKLVSAAGFQLKVSGWYKTDYSAKGKPKSAQDSSQTGEGKSDSGSKSAENKSSDTQSSSSSQESGAKS